MRGYERASKRTSQLTYLTDSLTYLNQTREEAEGALCLPYNNLMGSIIQQWTSGASLDQRKPAALQTRLLTRESMQLETVEVMVEVANRSDLVLENVTLTLLPGDGYTPLIAEAGCDILRAIPTLAARSSTRSARCFADAARSWMR